MSTTKTFAIVPAAGTGLRMGGETKKQFLRIDDDPILAITLKAIAAAPSVCGVIVPLPADEMEMVRVKIVPSIVGADVLVVAGGGTRQESVRNGFAALPTDAAIVLTHDGVRPFIDSATIEAVIDAAREHGAAVAAVPVKETVKRVSDGFCVEPVDREGLVRIQTPQAFRVTLLRKALEEADAVGAMVTDETSLMELIDAPVRIIAGDERNIKVTTPDDLIMARALVRQRLS